MDSILISQDLCFCDLADLIFTSTLTMKSRLFLAIKMGIILDGLRYTIPTVLYINYQHLSPNLSLIKTSGVFSANSGSTLTSTNSNTLYAKCRLQYPSSQTPSQSLSTIPIHTSLSREAKNLLQIAGGRASTIVLAHVLLTNAISDGGGGVVDGMLEFGKRDCRS